MIVITTDHAGHDPERHATAQTAPRYWEVPARAEAMLGALIAAGLTTRPATGRGRAVIDRVHDAGYLNFLETAFPRWQATPNAGPVLRPAAFAGRHALRRPEGLMGQAGYYLNALSAPLVAGTWSAALGSAHAAIDAADAVIGGDRFAYALCRPPGHHAHTDTGSGFCYLNNAAIAAQHMLDRGAGPVAILDFDVHHGNGTQQIFYERDDVFYVSTHGDPRFLFPWFVGYEDETGQGRGLGWNLNLPLPPGTSDAAFVEAIGRGLDAIAARKPAALIISAGFDAQEGDPAANLAVTAAGFRATGERIAALNLPTVIIQEGGYLVEKLGANLTAFLTGLGVIR